jgi:hypothetical protein
MLRLGLSDDFTAAFFAQQFERTEKFLNSSSSGQMLRTIVSYDTFERLLWLMFRVNPSVVQISRSGVPMSHSERSSIDIIRSLHKIIEQEYSVAVNYAEELDPDLALIARDVADFFGGSVHIALFLTPPQCRSFLPHSDAVDVIAMQLEGEKIWSVAGDSDLATKPRTETGETPSYRCQYALLPGDLLYVPRGLTHSVVGAGQTLSLHASVALNPIRRMDVIAEALAGRERSTRELRESALRTTSVVGERHMANDFGLEAKFEYSRRELSIATTQVAADRFSKLAQPPGRLRFIAASREFDPDAVYAKHPGMPVEVLFGSHSNQALIAFPGLARDKVSPRDSFLQFPGIFISALEFVRDARQPFRCDQLPGPFPDRLKAGLIERLWKEGLLRSYQGGSA